jgi:hypothetical protein
MSSPIGSLPQNTNDTTSYNSLSGQGPNTTGGSVSGIGNFDNSQYSVPGSVLSAAKGFLSPALSGITGGLGALLNASPTSVISPTGMLGDIISGKPVTPEDTVSTFAELSPPTALGFGITKLLEALGVNPTNAPTNAEPSSSSLGADSSSGAANLNQKTPNTGLNQVAAPTANSAASTGPSSSTNPGTKSPLLPYLQTLYGTTTVG